MGCSLRLGDSTGDQAGDLMEEPMKALKISVVLTALALAAVPSMAQTRSDKTTPNNTTTNSPGASEYAPGQMEKGDKGASTNAPGQMEKGDKGASTNSPGHKMQNSDTPSGSTGSSTGTGSKH